MQIFFNGVHMDINFRYASIIDKKINFLAQVIKGNIFNFFRYRDFWAILYYENG